MNQSRLHALFIIPSFAPLSINFLIGNWYDISGTLFWISLSFVLSLSSLPLYLLISREIGSTWTFVTSELLVRCSPDPLNHGHVLRDHSHFHLSKSSVGSEEFSCVEEFISEFIDSAGSDEFVCVALNIPEFVEVLRWSSSLFRMCSLACFCKENNRLEKV